MEPDNLDDAYQRFLSMSEEGRAEGLRFDPAEVLYGDYGADMTPNRDAWQAVQPDVTTEQLDGIVERVVTRSTAWSSDITTLTYAAANPNLSDESRELLKGFDDPEAHRRAAAMAERSSQNMPRRMFQTAFIAATSGVAAVSTFMASGFGLAPALGGVGAVAGTTLVAMQANNMRTDAQFKQSHPVLTDMYQKAAARKAQLGI